MTGEFRNLFSLCSRTPKPSQEKDYQVAYYLYNYKVLYECNGFFFNQHKYVVEYYSKLLSGKDRNKRPKGAMDCKYINPYKPSYLITVYKNRDILKSNPFCDKIYERVWLGCDYDCFAANNFRLLKQGYVVEINEYRRLHDATPLIVDPFLNKLANEQANESCLKKPSLFRKYPHIGYLGGVFPVKHANLIITKMYDKFLTSYNWHAKRHEGKYDKNAQILWKSTKRVGVGVCVKYNQIYVTFLFSPRGCTKHFHNNVRPISPKHIHMFAVFGRNLAV
uniref:SCP domain-containing protein n=1 Tax=Strongyloides papillosus TaxID=174720 RepID=A0A0N5BS51_STREA